MDDVRFTEVSLAPAAWATIPAVALLALLVLAVRHERAARSANKHLKLTTILWTLPHLLVLVAATVWYALGAGSGNVIALVASCLICTCGGRLALHRDDRFPPLPLLLAGVTLCGVLALELCGNARPYLMGPQFWAVETALVAGLTTGTWLLCGRRGAAPAMVVAFLAALGIVEHYVLEFRGTAILPSDLLAFRTALSVSQGYTYDLSAGILLGLAAASAGIALCSLLWRGEAQRLRVRDLAAGAVVLGLTGALAVVPNYERTFGAGLDYWWSKDWYERQGFFPSFIYAWQDLDIRAPEGYSDEAATHAQSSLAARHDSKESAATRREASQAQFAELRPNILVVQNETFCDLSVFDGASWGYGGPRFWNEGLGDAFARGQLAVSVFGGGTCNTEFEFLTGGSLAFLGAAKYPFSMYDLSGVASLPRQLAEQGYHTVGMHPNVASNWDRDRAYAQLGFDEFLDESAFEGAELYHTHVSDWATYEQALRLLRDSDEPLFVFDVTMQNHSGYDTGSIPADDLGGYAIDGLDADNTFQLNEFLACIEESDRALQRLVEELRQLDEPCVLVMYGDHHPWFSEAINDLVYANEDSLPHAERIHNTCYVAWANYDVAGGTDAQADGQDASADLLAAMVLDATGAPTTEFQQAQLGARQDVRAVNASGWLGTDDTWRPLSDEVQTLQELRLAEHLNFGSKLR